MIQIDVYLTDDPKCYEPKLIRGWPLVHLGCIIRSGEVCDGGLHNLRQGRGLFAVEAC